MNIWGNHRITTFRIIAMGFAAMILIGTVLLMLPVSGSERAGFQDCLFTATSAVCVTGLRKKLEPSPDASMLIQTHVGIGYRMIKISDG